METTHREESPENKKKMKKAKDKTKKRMRRKKVGKKKASEVTGNRDRFSGRFDSRTGLKTKNQKTKMKKKIEKKKRKPPPPSLPSLLEISRGVPLHLIFGSNAAVVCENQQEN